MVYFFFFIVLAAIVLFAVSTVAAFMHPMFIIPALLAVILGWWAAGRADYWSWYDAR